MFPLKLYYDKGYTMLVTIKEAAKIKNVAKGKIKDMIQNGELEYTLENGVYKVNIEEMVIVKKSTVIKSKKINNLLVEITNGSNEILDVTLDLTFIESNECHSNVGKMIDKYGGERVYVWLYTDMHRTEYLQFHSIWKSPQGKLIEVTKNNAFPYKKSVYVLDKVNSVKIDKFYSYYDVQSPPNIYVKEGIVYSEYEPYKNGVYTDFKYVSQKVLFVNNLKYINL